MQNITTDTDIDRLHKGYFRMGFDGSSFLYILGIAYTRSGGLQSSSSKP